MAVTFNQPTPHSELVADRHLYLDKSGTLLLEEGDAAAASLLSARGRPIDEAVVDGLGLILTDGRIGQDYPGAVARLSAELAEADRVREDVYDRMKAYRKEHAVEHAHFAAASKPIPGALDLERVQAEARYDQARVRLARTTQAQGGKAW